MYASISDGVGVGGTTTTSRIKRDLAVVAAAAACPTVNCAPTQSCPLQWHTSLESQSVIKSKCSLQYFILSCPNTGSLIMEPPRSRAASVH